MNCSVYPVVFSLASEEMGSWFENTVLSVERDNIAVVFSCITFSKSAHVQRHLRSYSWLYSFHEIVLFKGPLAVFYALAERERNLHHRSLVLFSQRSDLVREHLECDIYWKVNKSGMSLGVSRVDWIKLDLAFRVLLHLIYFYAFSLIITLQIPLIDEYADDVLVLCE